MKKSSRFVSFVVLVFVFGFCSLEAVSDMRVRAWNTPPTRGSNRYYISNASPLLPSPLIKLPIGSIRPEGWLRQQLELMRDGMVGHLPELSPWCRMEGNSWVDPEGLGHSPWEELPYWLKGFADLGYVLGDERIIGEAREWIEGVLGTQRPNGYFGPQANLDNNDIWPNMVMLNVLQSHYEATGNERILPFMLRYFEWQRDYPVEKLLPGSWQKIRAGDNLQSIYWLYNRTYEKWLLKLAEGIHQRTARWDGGMTAVTCEFWHGVNICQAFRQPAQYYQQSRNRRHLEATERIYATVMDLYGQVPGGMFGADEEARVGYYGPRQAAETCSMVEFMHSFQTLAKITGDPIYADRCEDVAFNSLPAAMTSDQKALHYLTAPNMIRLDRICKAPDIMNTGFMFPYSPGIHYRCCQHNVSHGWPYYAEHLWMATPRNGLAALLYAPSVVEATVGSGVRVTIRQETEYPFRDRVTLHLETDKPVNFPLFLRIPGWCKDASIRVNETAVNRSLPPGRFVRIERIWRSGDRIDLHFPMEISIRVWEKNHHSVSIDRGPLTYSLAIEERWEKINENERWPEWEVFPDSPWNFALELNHENPADSFRVVESQGPIAGQPFTPETAPVRLLTKGRRIPAWKIQTNGLIGRIQQSPIRTVEPEEEIALIPMGSARLRVSAFPVVGRGPDAHEWKEPPKSPEASTYFNNILAPFDGIVPDKSSDRTIPRFTWWDHRGTEEWIVFWYEEPRTISSSKVFWYDDTGFGACRIPKSWKIQWWNGEGWQEVHNASEYETLPDTFNEVRFEPVTTTGVRLQTRLQEGFSGGILEWVIE